MTRTGRVLAAVIATALLAYVIVMQGALAEQISMITGRVTVNGHPQENAFVSGFGSSAMTGADGTYILKFEDAGYGVINASYGGYNTSSGLMVLPTSPLIKVRDLDIAIPGYSAPAGNTAVNTTVTPAPTMWTKVLAPTGVIEPVQQKMQAPSSSGIIYLMAGMACLFFIGFAAYLVVRK